MSPSREESDRPRKKIKLSSQSAVLNSPSTLFAASHEISHVFNSLSVHHTESIVSTDKYTVSNTPFPSIVFNNLFNDSLLSKVKQQLLALPYFPRKSDLFSYFGTNDLSDDTVVKKDSALARLRAEMYSETFLNFLQDATGIELTLGKMDMSSHIYKRGDWLGCHDDDIEAGDEGRRIAFVISLVDEDWQESDGGNLVLFDLDSGGNPSQIKYSVAPKWNRMALFEVTPSSYHEVQEVTTPSTQPNRFRLSISGWFHGPLSSRLALRGFQSLTTTSPCTTKDLIAPKYLNPTHLAELKEEFIESSALQIEDFLLPEVIAAIQSEQTKWNDQSLGPPSIRRYHIAEQEGPMLRQVREWLVSQEGWDFIKSLTGLEDGSPRVRTAARLFRRDCYTMIHDHAQESLGLDLVLSLGESTKSWNTEWGGSLIYSSAATEKDQEDEDPLFVGRADSNVLCFVLRDKGVLKHVERVNCRIEDGGVQGRVDLEALYKVKVDQSEESEKANQ